MRQTGPKSHGNVGDGSRTSDHARVYFVAKTVHRYARAELLNMSVTLTLEYNGQETTSDHFEVLLYTGQAVAALTDPLKLFRDVP